MPPLHLSPLPLLLSPLRFQLISHNLSTINSSQVYNFVNKLIKLLIVLITPPLSAEKIKSIIFDRDRTQSSSLPEDQGGTARGEAFAERRGRRGWLQTVGALHVRAGRRNEAERRGRRETREEVRRRFDAAYGIDARFVSASRRPSGA